MAAGDSVRRGRALAAAPGNGPGRLRGSWPRSGQGGDAGAAQDAVQIDRPAETGRPAPHAASAASGVRWLTFGSTSFASRPSEVCQASALSA